MKQLTFDQHIILSITNVIIFVWLDLTELRGTVYLIMSWGYEWMDVVKTLKIRNRLDEKTMPTLLVSKLRSRLAESLLSFSGLQYKTGKCTVAPQ